MKSQLRRAATSIALNIAEGSTGQTDSEQVRFLGMALRSLVETVACQLLIRHRYTVDNALAGQAYMEAQHLARKIQSIRRSLDPEQKWMREEAGTYTTNDDLLTPDE